MQEWCAFVQKNYDNVCWYCWVLHLGLCIENWKWLILWICCKRKYVYGLTIKVKIEISLEKSFILYKRKFWQIPDLALWLRSIELKAWLERMWKMESLFLMYEKVTPTTVLNALFWQKPKEILSLGRPLSFEWFINGFLGWFLCRNFAKDHFLLKTWRIRKKTRRSFKNFRLSMYRPLCLSIAKLLFRKWKTITPRSL